MTHNYESIFEHFEVNDSLIHKVMLGVDYDDWFDNERKVQTERDYNLRHRRELVGETQSSRYFHALSRSIIGQQLSNKAARSIYNKFLDLFKDQEVTVENILKLEDQKLRNAGLSWQKVSYIKDLAKKLNNNELELDILSDLADQEVIELLTKVKGIGKWTAEMFLMFTLQRPDVFSFGDLGLKKGLNKIYNVDMKDLKSMEKVISKWSPYKTYGSIALWHSLDN